MKKHYESISVCFIAFKQDDVVRTSGGEGIASDREWTDIEKLLGEWEE